MTANELLDWVAATYPDYWAWAQANKPTAVTKIKAKAKELAAAVTGEGAAAKRELTAYIEALASYQNFLENPAEVTEEEVVAEEEDTTEADAAAAAEAEAEAEQREDIRQLLREFLEENELPTSLMNWVESALSQGWNADRIIYELRRTPEYLQAYPENAERLRLGFDWMPEAEIRAYRSEARRLSHEYFGYAPSNTEISELIVRNKSLVEWERQIQDYFAMERFGEPVRMALEWVLGYSISDEELWKFFSRDIPTPEWDAAVEKARMMGQPAVLGMGIRPEEEADILRSYGINPDEAFRGYQQMAAELPRATRLSAIETEITRLGDRFPGELSLGFMDLFKAIQLRDMDSIMKLQQQLAREVARWQAGGGPAGGGAGLLPPEQR